ncbi:MAG: TIGR00282 family metallophosphoesterase [Planctomycetota bacterium]
MRVLAIGDVVGNPGRAAVHALLPRIVREHSVDFVVCNGENIAGGSGITPNLFHKLRRYGCDVVTLGDHCYKRFEIAETLRESERLLRPANLSDQGPGRRYTIVKSAGGVRVAVFTLLGRIYMNQLPPSDPFAEADAILRNIGKGADVIVAEVHCEASSEKIALGWHLDGRAHFVFGTHTHTPTADARLLHHGTAFISDLGMTGPYDGVLGRKTDAVVATMRTNMPHPFHVATKNVRLCGALATIEDGKAVAIERVDVALEGEVGNDPGDG